MTDDLTPILEDLRGVDFETWKDVKFALVNACLSIDSPGRTPIEESTRSDIIQGCIQRAIAASGWKGILLFTNKYEPHARAVILKYKGGFSADEKLAETERTTPATAILAAYIAAKKVNA